MKNTICYRIGRSCYAGDNYLKNTLVYDFRVYNRALSLEEVMISELAVGDMINKLEAAQKVTTSIPSIANSPYNVYSSIGTIHISGTHNGDKIRLHDLTGRPIPVSNPEQIRVKAGVYLVTINEHICKVIVK